MENVIFYLNKVAEGFWAFSGSMLIQSSTLIVLLLVIDFLIRKRVRAVFRYCIWMLVFIKLLLPPTLCLPTGIGYWCGWESAKVVSTVPTDEQVLTPNLEPSVQLDMPSVVTQDAYIPPQQPEDLAVITPTVPLTWQAFVFFGWLVGVLVLSVLLIQRFLFVRSLIAQSELADGQVLEILNQCQRQVGITRPIELRLTANMLSPAACGLLNPVILMPASLLEKLTEEKLKTVLIHELAHIKRGDLWVNFLQTVLQIVYFYNPLLWIANAIIRGIREKAVDEMVLTKLGNEADSYSNTLIDIAEIAFSRPHFSLRLVGVVESKRALKDRIKHILSRPFPKSAKVGVVGLTAVLITAAVLLPMAEGEKSKEEIQNSAVGNKADEIIMLKTAIKVLDESGNAVAGAEIRPDGLRTKFSPASYYSWLPERHGEPKSVLTDETGTAEISYPQYVIEKLETGKISFSVTHPKYCGNRETSYSVKTNADPIILKKGATVRVSGYIQNKDNLVDEIYPQISSRSLRIGPDSWKEIEPGVFECKQVDAGSHLLRLVCFAEDGKTYFSETLSFEAERGQLYNYNLNLEPGGCVEGQLDESVPRPITNGRVVAQVNPTAHEKGALSIKWRTWAEIDSEGRFVFESLPRGCLQLTGLCDGFVSVSPDNKEWWIVKPQLFTLDRETVHVKLLMEPSATCEVNVVSDKNEPIEGATVVFWPNVGWQDRSGEIFASFLLKSEEMIKTDTANLRELFRQSHKNDFQAITNKEGLAVIQNLPGFEQDFNVSHDNYEMPLVKKSGQTGQRYGHIALTSGEEAKVTVKMQK